MLNGAGSTALFWIQVICAVIGVMCAVQCVSIVKRCERVLLQTRKRAISQMQRQDPGMHTARLGVTLKPKFTPTDRTVGGAEEEEAEQDD